MGAPPVSPPSAPVARSPPMDSPSAATVGVGPGDRASSHPASSGGPTRRGRASWRLTAAAGPTPSARCSARRGRRAGQAAARHRGRAAPDGRPRVRRVAPSAARDASRDRSSHAARRAPLLSAQPVCQMPRGDAWPKLTRDASVAVIYIVSDHLEPVMSRSRSKRRETKRQPAQSRNSSRAAAATPRASVAGMTSRAISTTTITGGRLASMPNC